MKKILIALLSLILADVHAQANFHKAYSTPNYDEARFVDQLGSGKYFVAGSSTGAGWGGYNTAVLYLDLYGDTIWTRYIGGQYHDFFIDATVSVTTGELIVVSEELNGFTPENNMRVTSIDIFGNVSWSTLYPSSYTKHAKAICATSDGGFAITGNCDSVVADSAGIFILRCNASGLPLWFKAYTGTQLYGSGTSICSSADGGLLVAGQLFNPSVNTRTIVIKTDAQGTVAWCRVFDLNMNIDEPNIAEQPSMDILLSGCTFGASGNSFVYAAGLTSGGNVSWFKSYVPASGEHYRLTDAALSVSSGALTMIGFHDTPTSTCSYMLRVSGTGVLQQSLLYATNNHDTYLHGVDISNDGGVVMTGRVGGVSTPNDSSGIVVIKSSLFANSVCGQSNIGLNATNATYTQPFASAFGVAGSWIPAIDTPAVQSGFQYYNGCAVNIEVSYEGAIEIFPNPSTESFYIHYASLSGDIIVIRNSLGAEVMHTTEAGGEVSLKNCATGLYYVQVIRDGKLILQAKLSKL